MRRCMNQHLEFAIKVKMSKTSDNVPDQEQSAFSLYTQARARDNIRSVTDFIVKSHPALVTYGDTDSIAELLLKKREESEFDEEYPHVPVLVDRPGVVIPDIDDVCFRPSKLEEILSRTRRVGSHTELPQEEITTRVRITFTEEEESLLVHAPKCGAGFDLPLLESSSSDSESTHDEVD